MTGPVCAESDSHPLCASNATSSQHRRSNTFIQPGLSFWQVVGSDSGRAFKRRVLLQLTVKLAGYGKRNFQSLGQRLDAVGYVSNLLLPVFCSPRSRMDQLEVVNDKDAMEKSWDKFEEELVPA